MRWGQHSVSQNPIQNVVVPSSKHIEDSRRPHISHIAHISYIPHIPPISMRCQLAVRAQRFREGTTMAEPESFRGGRVWGGRPQAASTQVCVSLIFEKTGMPKF